MKLSNNHKGWSANKCIVSDAIAAEFAYYYNYAQKYDVIAVIKSISEPLGCRVIIDYMRKVNPDNYYFRIVKLDNVNYTAETAKTFLTELWRIKYGVSKQK